VGDSRIYFLRGERLFCLTRDHTLVQDLVESGALTEEQASDHPRAHVLTRALGHGEPLSVDVSSWMLLTGEDVLLLCSDGLSAYVSDEAIREALVTRAPAGELAHGLVQAALEQGSTDNISAAVVRIGEERSTQE
jgi:serine/threonine protein phosphatase PrpC